MSEDNILILPATGIFWQTDSETDGEKKDLSFEEW